MERLAYLENNAGIAPVVYSGTTLENFINGLEETEEGILFRKTIGVHEMPDIYFTPNLQKAAFYAFRNYLNGRNGKPIILEGMWPENYNADPNQNSDDTFITRDPLMISNIWAPSARLSDPLNTVIGLYGSGKNLTSEFRRRDLFIRNLNDLKDVMRGN